MGVAHKRLSEIGRAGDAGSGVAGIVFGVIFVSPDVALAVAYKTAFIAGGTTGVVSRVAGRAGAWDGDAEQ